MCPRGGRVVVRPASRPYAVHREHTSGEELVYIAVLALLGRMLTVSNKPHRESHTREYRVKTASKCAVAELDLPIFSGDGVGGLRPWSALRPLQQNGMGFREEGQVGVVPCR